jgi:hypothetical protein
MANFRRVAVRRRALLPQHDMRCAKMANVGDECSYSRGEHRKWATLCDLRRFVPYSREGAEEGGLRLEADCVILGIRCSRGGRLAVMLADDVGALLSGGVLYNGRRLAPYGETVYGSTCPVLRMRHASKALDAHVRTLGCLAEEAADASSIGQTLWAVALRPNLRRTWAVVQVCTKYLGAIHVLVSQLEDERTASSTE